MYYNTGMYDNYTSLYLDDAVAVAGAFPHVFVSESVHQARRRVGDSIAMASTWYVPEV
jgi:hypothetical protein